LDHLNGFGMYASMYFIFLSLLSIPATPVDGEISRDALRSGLAKDREGLRSCDRPHQDKTRNLHGLRCSYIDVRQ
jgi:hypothetical protein